MTRTSSKWRRRAAAVLAWVGAAAPGACAPEPSPHQIDIRDLVFAPNVWEVRVGDTVTWTNHDIVPHTVTGPGGTPESGEMGAGQSFSWVATEPGALTYGCRFHPGMEGTLRIR